MIDNIGAEGEEAAVGFLLKSDYGIWDRNYQNSFGRRMGELDIVAFDNKEKMIVFVEVKTREAEKWGDTLPEENITPAKLKKLSKIASSYLRQHHLEDAPYRFDALSVWLSSDGNFLKFKHIIGL